MFLLIYGRGTSFFEPQTGLLIFYVSIYVYVCYWKWKLGRFELFVDIIWNAAVHHAIRKAIVTLFCLHFFFQMGIIARLCLSMLPIPPPPLYSVFQLRLWERFFFGPHYFSIMTNPHWRKSKLVGYVCIYANIFNALSNDSSCSLFLPTWEIIFSVISKHEKHLNLSSYFGQWRYL